MPFEMRYAEHMRELPSNPIFDLMPKLNEPGFISFAAGVPSPDSFPVQTLGEMCQDLLAGRGAELLQYGSTEGYPPLRESIACLFERAGISARPDELFITTGGQQTIDLLCKLFIAPGDAVLVESPTYSATLQILGTYRANPVEVPSDSDGMLPDALEDYIIRYSPKFVYVIPNFQNPSGTTLAKDRRSELARVTAKHGVLLIEDDPYRELRYLGEHLPTIKSFDECGNVLYMTSTSKIICPGLRVGAIMAPGDLVEHLKVAKQAADMHSPNITQALVDAYLRSGLLDSHLLSITQMYRERLAAMLDALEGEFPKQAEYTRPQGGLFIWCKLPDSADTAKLLPQAVDRKVAFIPGEQFFAGGGVTNYMRLNFSNAPVQDIRRGIKLLGGILRETLN